MEKVQKKHLLEKQQVLADVQTMRDTFMQQTQQLAEQYKGKVNAFRSEIDGMNAKFQEKIQSFEASTQELKAALAAARKSGSADMEQLKKAHEVELSNLVRTSNEKYQALVVSHLKELEDLNAATARQVAAAREETKKTMSEEMAQQLGQLRAKLEGDKQDALLAAKRDFEVKLKQMKDEATEKYDALNGDLKAKVVECNKLQKEKDDLSAELNRRMREYALAIDAQSSDAEGRFRQLNETIAAKEAQIVELKSQLAERYSDIEKLENRLASNASSILNLQETVEQQKQSIAQLMDELTRTSKEGASQEAAMRARISALEKDVASMTEDISKNGKLLLAAREEIKAKDTAAKAAAAEAARSLEEARREMDALQKRLQDALRNSKSAEDGLSQELASLKSRLAAAEEKARKDLAEANQLHAAAMESLRSSHSAALAKAESDLREANLASTTRELAMRKSLDEMQREHEAEAARRAEEARRTLEEVRAEHGAEVGVLKATIAALEQQLDDASKSADGEKGALKNELSKLGDKAKALQRELEAKKKDSERIESVCTGLKNQVESLREELKASQAAFREKMEGSMAKLDADWQAKMDALKAEHEAALAAALRNADSALADQLAEQRRVYEEEIAALKSALKKEAADASEQLVNAEHERLRLEEELSAARKAHEAAMKELKESHRAELLQAEERRKKEVDSLRRELTSNSESSHKALADKHAAEVASLQEGMEKALAELRAAHAAEMQSAQELAAQTLRAQLAELDGKLNADKLTALAASAARHANEKAKLEEDRDLTVSGLKDRIAALERSVSLSQQEVRDIHAQLESERRDKAVREEQVVLERDQMQRDHQVDVRKEKERAQRALTEAADRSAQEARELRNEHAGEKSRLEEVIRSLKDDLKIAGARYDARESRQEDLDMIQRLQEEMVEKDRLVAQTREEMLYFKREMLNREESYNKKFNAAPNVGVMQVIKPKEPEKTGMGGGGPSGKKATPPQFRPLNPAGGAAMPGMGVGGVGGLAMSGSAGGVGTMSGGGGSVKGK
jgi:hypothetical protein